MINRLGIEQVCVCIANAEERLFYWINVADWSTTAMISFFNDNQIGDNFAFFT